MPKHNVRGFIVNVFRSRVHPNLWNYTVKNSSGSTVVAGQIGFTTEGAATIAGTRKANSLADNLNNI